MFETWYTQTFDLAWIVWGAHVKCCCWSESIHYTLTDGESPHSPIQTQQPILYYISPLITRLSIAKMVWIYFLSMPMYDFKDRLSRWSYSVTCTRLFSALASYYNTHIRTIFTRFNILKSHSEGHHPLVANDWEAFSCSCFTFARFSRSWFCFSGPLDFSYCQCKMSFSQKKWIQKLFSWKGNRRGALTSSSQSIIKQDENDPKLNNRCYSINCIFRSLRRAFMCPVCCTNRRRNLWTLRPTTV